MANSSLGLRIGIPPDIAQKLREQSSHFHDTNADSSLLGVSVISAKKALPTDETTETLPGILIHVEKLVGYKPNDKEEVEAIQSQLVEAMWARFEQTTSEELVDVNKEQSPPPDFDLQVMEFFDSGLARYCDYPDYKDDGRLFIKYPTYLQSPVTGERIATMKLVQELRKAPPLDFAQKIWKYLGGCSRTLFWKRDMAAELSHIVREEQARLDYQQWTESKRQNKLDNLYSVRETLVHQVEMAKSKVEVLEEEREGRVKEAMEPFLRMILQRQQDSMNAFGTSDLSFPDEFQWLGLRDEPLDEENEWVMDSNNSSDDEDHSRSVNDDASYDETCDIVPDEASLADKSAGDEVENDDFSVERVGDAAENTDQTGASPCMALEASLQQPQDSSEIRQESSNDSAEGTVEGDKPALSLPFQRRKKHREKAKRRKKEERQAAEKKAREEQLKKLEYELRTKLTSKELILAQTMHNALAEKMIRIEDLLDALQDEVWQAEEEAEKAGGSKRPIEQDVEPAFSLLDQVLAMILGATPNDGEKNPEEYFLAMQVEHRRIVEAWKAHFGRLPPPARLNSRPAQSSQDPFSDQDPILSSQDQRQQLGITENDTDDWEALDSLLEVVDDESKVPLPNGAGEESAKKQAPTKEQKQPPAPRLVGLRPGGRVVRPSS
jgi:hypothetical protein